MRVLSLSLDSTILEKNSNSSLRMIEYGVLAEKYYIIAPSVNNREIVLSENVQVKGTGGKNRFCQLLEMYRSGKAALQNEKYDCITVQDPFEAGLIGYLLKRKFKIGLNVQEHGDFFSNSYWRQERFLHLLRYYLGVYILKKADSIRVVSMRIKKYLVDVLRIDEDKIIVVPVYTDKNPKAKFLVGSLASKNDFVFLNMGRFVKQKNLPLLLNAFAQVLQKHPGVKLQLIGKGPEESKLKKISSELNLTGQIEFIGWTDDADSFYRQADAYVLSSNYEGWGRVIIEASAAGVPIIMTDVGCAGETMINEESALISPVDNIEKLAQNMMRIVEDKELRQKLVNNSILELNMLPDKQKTLELYKDSWRLAIGDRQ